MNGKTEPRKGNGDERLSREELEAALASHDGTKRFEVPIAELAKVGKEPPKPATPPMANDPKKANTRPAAAKRPRQPKLEAPKSLLDEILAAGGQTTHVAEAINMANTILTNEGAITTFVETIKGAEALYMNRLGFERIEQDVRQELDGMDLQAIEQKLASWGKEGDSTATALLTPLTAFHKSAVDVLGPLWSLYTEIIRPARRVRTYYELSQLLKRLVEKGLVERLARRHYPEKAIVLGDEQHATGYLPAMERGSVVPMAEAGWPWMKKAEEAAKETLSGRAQKLDKLNEETTPGFMPADVESGKEGVILLRTPGVGLNSGALLRIRNKRFVVIEAVGLRTERKPWMSTDSRRDEWPSKDIHDAFRLWMKSFHEEEPIDPSAKAE